METNKFYYFEHLYPLQDHVLGLINAQDTGFYLTGGTALARVYLQHRLSDDLLDLARRLCTATLKDWQQVRWIDSPDSMRYLADLNRLGEQLILV